MRRRPPRILAVDDQPLNLELLGAYLSGVDCELTIARDGFQALAQIAARQPDLVLLDVVMPGIDGFEVCRRIKADPANRLLPIVLVTSLSDVDNRVRGLEVGADDILAKPIDRNELMVRVLTLIRTKEIVDNLDNAEHVMLAFAKAVEAKDCGTEAHVERVARGSRALGDAAGLRGADLDSLYFGGVVHDVGKIGVPDAVLLKPGPLTAAEMELMRRHVLIGVDIALPLRSAASVVPIIRHHHEHFDGSGYPDGLRGEDIPLVARIVAVCDSYDAMISDRPYRAAMSSNSAAGALLASAGTQWDPKLVKLFITTVLHNPWGLPSQGSQRTLSFSSM